MSEVEVYKASVGHDITLSDVAIAHVQAYLLKEGAKGLRLSVKKTGCSGLSYVMAYVDAPSENDVLIPINADFLLCVDKGSYPFLKGMRVDYVKQGLNQRFAFDNPNEKGQCGCGESFTVSEQ
jgi:iron-sulfur cluster assembly accessory protein